MKEIQDTWAKKAKQEGYRSRASYKLLQINEPHKFIQNSNMIIGSILENHNFEKRVAITPDIVKKYISLGFEIFLEKNYGSHLGFSDQMYSDLGAKIKDVNEILKNSNLIVQPNILSDEKLSLLVEKQSLIGVCLLYTSPSPRD